MSILEQPPKAFLAQELANPSSATSTALNATFGPSAAGMLAAFAAKSVETSKLDVSAAPATIGTEVSTTGTPARKALDLVFLPPTNVGGDWSQLPNLLRRLQRYNDGNPTSIKVLGLGSSVGVGATLPDSATQPPVQVFAQYLRDVFNVQVTVYNGSVNGTVVGESTGASGDYADAKTAAGWTPDVVFTAYGMNDGTSAQYHAGQTLPGVATNFRNLIAAVRADGADIVVSTTPHPHTVRAVWTMPEGVPATYPTDSGSNPVQVPDSTTGQSIKTDDPLGVGLSVPHSVRHRRVNFAQALTASRLGVAVVDAERFWFLAVAQNGEDALFNTGEIVHPNLLGHQKSYWLAIKAFMHGLANSLGRGGRPSVERFPIVKAADETRTATTTLADDAELVMPFRAYDMVEFEALLFVSSPPAADFKIGMTFPASSTGQWGIQTGLDTAVTGISGDMKNFVVTAITDSVTVGGTGNRQMICVRGVVTIGPADGSIKLQWAQGTSDAGNTIVRASSMLKARVIN